MCPWGRAGSHQCGGTLGEEVSGTRGFSGNENAGFSADYGLAKKS